VSALATRLLVLGVVRIFEPANAYQLRRELLSWNVEQWANINPGSVYGMLASLQRAGLVERHALIGVNGRPVSVYTTTPAGGEEFPVLVLRGIRELADWAEITDLRAALSFIPYLPRTEVMDAVGDRIERLQGVLVEMERLAAADPGAPPPHVVEEFGLEAGIAIAQLDWLQRFRARLQGGALSFLGEPPAQWEPRPDDPGRAMVRDRQLYLSQLPPEG
jgi:DNA-binding PadR family transcriptional regulator